MNTFYYYKEVDPTDYEGRNRSVRATLVQGTVEKLEMRKKNWRHDTWRRLFRMIRTARYSTMTPYRPNKIHWILILNKFQILVQNNDFNGEDSSRSFSISHRQLFWTIMIHEFQWSSILRSKVHYSKTMHVVRWRVNHDWNLNSSGCDYLIWKFYFIFYSFAFINVQVFPRSCFEEFPDSFRGTANSRPRFTA